MLEDTKKALLNKNISLQVSLKAKKFILEKGTDLKYGARPLRRAIQRYVEDELSDKILKLELKDGQNVTIDIKNGELNFIIK